MSLRWRTREAGAVCQYWSERGRMFFSWETWSNKLEVSSISWLSLLQPVDSLQILNKETENQLLYATHY